MKRNDIGIILNTNLLFTTYFGYSKEEIVNKKINMLIPSIYHEVHDVFMKKFFSKIMGTSEKTENEYLTNEQFNYFRHKNGYIYPMHYKITLNLEMMQLFVKFRADTFFQSFVHFIIDEESFIKEMSPSAIKFFGIEAKNI